MDKAFKRVQAIQYSKLIRAAKSFKLEGDGPQQRDWCGGPTRQNLCCACIVSAAFDVGELDFHQLDLWRLYNILYLWMVHHRRGQHISKQPYGVRPSMYRKWIADKLVPRLSS